MGDVPAEEIEDVPAASEEAEPVVEQWIFGAPQSKKKKKHSKASMWE
jgi:hypothetical protein